MEEEGACKSELIHNVVTRAPSCWASLRDREERTSVLADGASEGWVFVLQLWPLAEGSSQGLYVSSTPTYSSQVERKPLGREAQVLAIGSAREELSKSAYLSARWPLSFTISRVSKLGLAPMLLLTSPAGLDLYKC